MHCKSGKIINKMSYFLETKFRLSIFWFCIAVRACNDKNFKRGAELMVSSHSNIEVLAFFEEQKCIFTSTDG